jgi:hypothetical protein
VGHSLANAATEKEITMAMPVGITRKTKDNSKKLHRNREGWMDGKKLGRKKQVWVWDVEPLFVEENDGGITHYTGSGHWEENNS